MEPLKTIYYALMVTSLLVFLYRRHQLSGKLSLIGPLLLCSLAVELFTDYSRLVLNQNDWYQYHLYQPVEYVLLALLFYANIKNRLVQRQILISIPLYLLIIGGYYVAYPAYFNTQKFIDFALESFFLIVWAILYLIELVNTDDVTDSVLHIPLFWVSFAVLLFYAGDMFIMCFRDYFSSYDKRLNDKLMLVPQYLNLLFYIMLIIGFLCTPIPRSSSSV